MLSRCRGELPSGERDDPRAQHVQEGEPRLRARPLLRALTEATRETANLVVLDDVQAVYIETVPSPQVVRLFTAVGNRTPLHATGAGKALLAALAPPRRDALIDRLEL